MPAVTIRRAGPADRATILAFVGALQEHERTVDPSKLTAAEAAEAYLAESEEAAARNQGAFYLAEQDGRALGFVGCWLDSDADVTIDVAWRTFGYISDIYVVPEARGTGLATRLYQRAENHCAALGMKRMRIGALGRNPVALRAHAKFGFRPLYTIFDKPIGPRRD